MYPGTSGREFIYDGTPPPNTLNFLGAPTNVGLFDIAPVAQGMSFVAQVRAVGWQAAADRTSGEYTPVDVQTPARATALAPDGTGYSVASESRSGHLQVILRTRLAGVWDGGFAVSQSSGSAFEPALTLLGADDLALVWRDTRQGTARLFYRARVGGTWTSEQILSTLPGEHRAPSIGADGKGGVYVAWVFVGQDLPRILYLRFPYLSPYGEPFTVSGAGSSPANPFVAAMPRGGAILIWTDNAAWPYSLWFSRCGPDSIPGLPKTLTAPSGLPQTWVSALVESSGAAHSLWIENSSTTSELHYQLRWADGGYAPEDTVLETSNSTLAKARLVRDPQGGLHVVFERSVNGVSQVRYRRRDPTLGWDASSTDITAGHRRRRRAARRAGHLAGERHRGLPRLPGGGAALHGALPPHRFARGCSRSRCPSPRPRPRGCPSVPIPCVRATTSSYTGTPRRHPAPARQRPRHSRSTT